mgnify:CR=1 FL=1
MIRKWLVLFLLFCSVSTLVACDDDDSTTDAGVDVPLIDTYVPPDVDDDAGDAS